MTPRNMSLNGTPARTLAYQLYQMPDTPKSGESVSVGNNFPMVQLNLLNLTPVTGSLTVSAQIVTPQTSAVPGSYQDSYTAATALVTLNHGLLFPPTTCGDTVAAGLPFTVSATVSKQCNITSATNISFAPAGATGRNLTASNTVGVACSNNTPYTIGLQPSNGNTAGSGVMAGTGSNTDKVPTSLARRRGRPERFGAIHRSILSRATVREPPPPTRFTPPFPARTTRLTTMLIPLPSP